MGDISLYEQSKDPAQIGYPPTLPVELALRTATPAQLQEEYGYDDQSWAALKSDPVFLKDLAQACEMVRKEGMSFKMKAKLQAEELLKKSWQMIHSPTDQVPASVSADLIKSTMRWAGYDTKVSAEGGNTNAFQINIMLGDQ